MPQPNSLVEPDTPLMLRLIFSGLKLACLLPLAACLMVGGCSTLPSELSEAALRHERPWMRDLADRANDAMRQVVGPADSLAEDSALTERSDALDHRGGANVVSVTSRRPARPGARLHQDLLRPWESVRSAPQASPVRPVSTSDSSEERRTPDISQAAQVWNPAQTPHAAPRELVIDQLGHGSQRILLVLPDAEDSDSGIDAVKRLLAQDRSRLAGDVGRTLTIVRDDRSADGEQWWDLILDLKPERVVFVETSASGQPILVGNEAVLPSLIGLRDRSLLKQRYRPEYSTHPLQRLADERLRAELLLLRLPTSYSPEEHSRLVERLLPVLLADPEADFQPEPYRAPPPLPIHGRASSRNRS